MNKRLNSAPEEEYIEYLLDDEELFEYGDDDDISIPYESAMEP